MFEVGYSELLLTAVVALLVLGPERLPRAARVGGLWLRRARASWYSVRAQFERELADEELKRSLQATRDGFDGMRDELRTLTQDPLEPAAKPRRPAAQDAGPAHGAPTAAEHEHEQAAAPPTPDADHDAAVTATAPPAPADGRPPATDPRR